MIGMPGMLRGEKPSSAPPALSLSLFPHHGVEQVAPLPPGLLSSLASNAGAAAPPPPWLVRDTFSAASLKPLPFPSLAPQMLDAPASSITPAPFFPWLSPARAPPQQQQYGNRGFRVSAAHQEEAVSSSNSVSVDPSFACWAQQLQSEDRGLYLIKLLLSCADASGSSNLKVTNQILEQLSMLSSLTGDPMQRVATYFMKALAARVTKAVCPGIYKALHSCHQPSLPDLLAARHLFFAVCPYLKFAFLAVNQAVMDVMQGHKSVHVVDLDAVDAVQWIALLKALAGRPEGPPHLRITGVNERKDVLDKLGQQLVEEAEKLGVAFQFHPVVSKLEEVKAEMLRVRKGEALAISSVMRLHLLLASEDQASGAGWSSFSFPKPKRGRRTPLQTSLNLCTGNGLSRRREPAERQQCGGLSLWKCKEEGGAGDTSGSTVTEERSQRQRIDVNRRSEESEESEAECLGKRGREHTCSSFAPAVVNFSFPHKWRGEEEEEEECVTWEEEKEEEEGKGSMERVLQMLRGLKPEVMVVVEQDSKHNSGALAERFVQALHYYCAMFDSLDCTLAQESPERVVLEQHLLGQQIHNIVACEGKERVERHEKLEVWKGRMERASFLPLHFSRTTSLLARRLLGTCFSDGYRLVEEDGCLTLCWKNTPLFSASAWHALY